MKMFQLFKNLFKVKAASAVVELHQSENGFYVIKCYGQWITSTVTLDKDAAERNYQYVKDVVAGKNKINHTLIKSYHWPKRRLKKIQQFEVPEGEFETLVTCKNNKK